MGNAVELNQANFEQEVLASGQPTLVDFWAPWCGPCRQLSPVIEQLAATNSGKAKIGKVNTDENPDLAIKYGADALPTLLVFQNGQVVQRFRGVQPAARLQAALDEASRA